MERLSQIVLEMQRCFVLHLSKELAPGNVSFPQFFLLTYLDQKEVLTMRLEFGAGADHYIGADHTVRTDFNSCSDRRSRINDRG